MRSGECGIRNEIHLLCVVVAADMDGPERVFIPKSEIRIRNLLLASGSWLRSSVLDCPCHPLETGQAWPAAALGTVWSIYD